MAYEEHLRILRQGVGAWNDWRCAGEPAIQPDLRRAGLRFADLSGANLRGRNLEGANLMGAALRSTAFSGANLRGANLSSAEIPASDLRGSDLDHANLSAANLCDAEIRTANLQRAILSRADLSRADLSRANLRGADLRAARLKGVRLGGANLSGADLRNADLSDANIVGASLSGARLNGALLLTTIFADLDLRDVIGLEGVRHAGPSEVSISTIYRSGGKIPEVFLRGCGMPDEFITQIPSLVAALQPIQFYSCFVSYSGRDEEFARRLHSRMRQEGLRVWFAPEDMKGGDKLYDQIDRAIQVHDRLLLVLSESSLRSRWVELEIRRARKVELREGRRKLFPIRLVSYEALQEWVCIDSTTGEDLAEEVRRYFIPDFSSWKGHDAFEAAFARLLADLKANA